MGTEDRELGPFKPAPDILILAAIERAVCHGASDAWIVVVGEHLGFPRAPREDRRALPLPRRLRLLARFNDYEVRFQRRCARTERVSLRARSFCTSLHPGQAVISTCSVRLRRTRHEAQTPPPLPGAGNRHDRPLRFAGR